MTSILRPHAPREYRPSLPALLLVLLACFAVSCDPSPGKSSGGVKDPPSEALAIESFSVTPDSWTDNVTVSKRLIFSWATKGTPVAYSVWTSADGTYSGIDTEIFSFDDGYIHDSHLVAVDPATAPRGLRWYLLVVRDAKGAEAYAPCQVDYGETGDPTMPVRPGAPIDSAFWGRWHRLDASNGVYIGDRSVTLDSYWTEDGIYNSTDLEIPAASATSDLLRLEHAALSSALEVRRLDAELLEVRSTGSGLSYLLYRSGAERIGFSGVVQYDMELPAAFKAARGLSGGRALTNAANVSLVIQNVLNATDRFTDVKAGADGVFRVGGALPDSTYSVTPLLKVEGGEPVPVGSIEGAGQGTVLVRPLLDGEDTGVVAVTDKGYRYKASAAYDPSEGYGFDDGAWRYFLVADSTAFYSLPFRISNFGGAATPAFKVTLSGRDGGLRFQDRAEGDYQFKEKVTAPCASIGAGGYADSWWNSRYDFIGMEIPENAFDFTGRDYVDTAIKVEIDDDADPDVDWTDFVPLRVFHNETARLSFNLSNSGGAGFLMSLITPDGLLVQAGNGWGGGEASLTIPVQSHAANPYRVILCGSTSSEEVQYSLSLGSDAATLGANTRFEPSISNTSANPEKLYMNQAFTSKLAMGTSAFFDLAFQVQAELGGLAPPEPFAPELSLSWTAPDSRNFVITRSLADGGEKAVLKSLADDYRQTSFVDTGAVPATPYFYTIQGFDPAKGYTKAVTVPGYLSPWRRTIIKPVAPASTSGLPYSPLRVFRDGPAGFATYDGNRLVRHDATGAFVSSFDLKAADLAPIRAADGSIAAWAATIGGALWRYDGAGGGSLVETLPHAGELLCSGGAIALVGSSQFTLYDGTLARTDGPAVLPAGNIGASASGGLVALMLDPKFVGDPFYDPLGFTRYPGELYFQNGTVSIYGPGGAGSPASSLEFSLGLLPYLARIPFGYEKDYDLYYNDGCWIGVDHPQRDLSGSTWIFMRGFRSYRPRLFDSPLPDISPAFSFVVRIDATGKMDGFFGGSEEDYPDLAATASDYEVDASGDLLLLRAGTLERYTAR